jgi:hypothetical protein
MIINKKDKRLEKISIAIKSPLIPLFESGRIPLSLNKANKTIIRNIIAIRLERRTKQDSHFPLWKRGSEGDLKRQKD